MMHDRSEWIERIKEVEWEHAALRIAIDRLLIVARSNPADFQGDVTLAIIKKASERLDGTYLIRLFAEFETGLRLYWSTARSTDPPSRTRDLLNGIASTCRISPPRISNAQAVREYRNALVHERDEDMTPIPLAEARQHLCRYFSFLPPSW
jgi:hypothetical protein